MASQIWQLRRRRNALESELEQLESETAELRQRYDTLGQRAAELETQLDAAEMRVADSSAQVELDAALEQVRVQSQRATEVGEGLSRSAQACESSLERLENMCAEGQSSRDEILSMANELAARAESGWS